MEKRRHGGLGNCRSRLLPTGQKKRGGEGEGLGEGAAEACTPGLLGWLAVNC
jgi:hypothetical protein